MARFSLFLLPLFLSISAPVTESPAQALWEAFLTNPSANTYKPLSAAVRICVVNRCHDADVAGRENNFANLFRLLALAESGNHYGMETAFQIRPLYKNEAAPSEDIDRSLGLSSTQEPTFFLELIQQYDIPTEMLRRLVVQTSIGSIDRLGIKREEWRSRIQSLSKVKDKRLLELRDKAVSFIQHEIDSLSAFPDDAFGNQAPTFSNSIGHLP
jgi:hypothetical protein